MYQNNMNQRPPPHQLLSENIYQNGPPPQNPYRNANPQYYPQNNAGNNYPQNNAYNNYPPQVNNNYGQIAQPYDNY